MNTCYAESRDGTHWTRPKLGLVEFEGSKENNIILTGPPGDWGSPTSNFFAFRDSNPQVAPEERYKGVGGINRGLYLLVSADGIHWKAKGSGPFMKHDMSKVPMINGFDSHNVIFWDAGRERYQAYLRDMYLSPGLGERTRSVRVTTSDDFVNWSYPDWIDMGEAPPDQLYTFSATPYFRAPHIYMAFPQETDEVPALRIAREVRCHAWDRPLRLGVHVQPRRRRTGDRRYLEGFVRPGSDSLDWTDRSNYVAAGLVPTGSDEMSVYVLRHFRLPSIHLRRGVLRADGFVLRQRDLPGRGTGDPARDLPRQEPDRELRHFGSGKRTSGDPGRSGKSLARIRSDAGRGTLRQQHRAGCHLGPGFGPVPSGRQPRAAADSDPGRRPLFDSLQGTP